MATTIEDVKAANRLEEIVEDAYPLRKTSARYWRAVQHDSLVLDIQNQAWFWNSRGEQGDVIAWVQAREGLDFKGAVEWLCRRARLEPPRWSEANAAEQVAARARYDALTVAARHWVHCLRKSQDAQDYCTGRGWTSETVQRAGLGFCDGDRKALVGEFRMHGVDPDSPAAKAALQVPSGMLIYPHVEGGRVVYVSARSLEDKKHYNPKQDLIGPRRLYLNFAWSPSASEIVIVEGQADALTLAQWGVPAVALAGLRGKVEELGYLVRERAVFVALDADQGGVETGRALCEALGPMARFVVWPEKDANAWLQSGATEDDCRALLDRAPVWALVLAKEVGAESGHRRQAMLRHLFEVVARLNDFEVQSFRQALAWEAGIGLRQFNGLLKVAREESAADADDGDDAIELLAETPGGYIKEHLFEMFWEPCRNGDDDNQFGKTRFAVRTPSEDIKVVERLEIGPMVYVPKNPMSRVISERVVQWADRLGPEMSTKSLLQAVQATIHKYVDVDDLYESLAAWYVIFTWLYDSFNTVPYLRMLGDAGTGKSRFLQVVGALCYRPIFVTGAATVSPIFRILDEYQGTLVLDEGDYSKSDEAADIIKILNTGYQRIQGVVLRAGDRNSGFEPEVFRVYGPKVIATRKRFADWALESRCLTQEMGGPTMRLDIPIDLPMAFWEEEAPQIRGSLLYYRLKHWKPQIELDYSTLDLTVEPRLNQVTVALTTLIDDPDLQADLKRFIREYNKLLISERGMSLAAKVVEVLVKMVGQPPEERDYTLKGIGKWTNLLIDAENLEEGEERSEHTPKVTPKKIGSILRSTLHLRTDRTGANGNYEVQWDEERVRSLAKRYGLTHLLEGEAG